LRLLSMMKQDLTIWLRKLVHKAYEYQLQTKNSFTLTVTSLNSEKMGAIKTAYERYIDAVNKTAIILTFKDRWFSAMQIQINNTSFHAVFYNDDLDAATLLLASSDTVAAFEYARVFYVNGRLFSKEAKTLFVKIIQNDLTPEMAYLLYR